MIRDRYVQVAEMPVPAARYTQRTDRRTFDRLTDVPLFGTCRRRDRGMLDQFSPFDFSAALYFVGGRKLPGWMRPKAHAARVQHTLLARCGTTCRTGNGHQLAWGQFFCIHTGMLRHTRTVKLFHSELLLELIYLAGYFATHPERNCNHEHVREKGDSHPERNASYRRRVRAMHLTGLE
jgi:hypothetical protein